LSAQNPATGLLAGKTVAGEMLIAAAEVQLPLTNKTLYEGKFLSTVDAKLRGRAYDKNGALVDAKAANKAERAAYRSQYGAWSPSDEEGGSCTAQRRLRCNGVEGILWSLQHVCLG